jgi:hypothetical protein
MSSVARPSSSQSIAPVATPSASSSFNTFNQNQGLRQPAAQHQGQTYAIPHGGLAPVDPLEPGSNVAPVLIQKPSGIDEGNSFCMGQCYASENEAQCDGPTVSYFITFYCAVCWRFGVSRLMVFDSLRLCIGLRMVAGCAASLLVISRGDTFTV